MGTLQQTLQRVETGKRHGFPNGEPSALDGSMLKARCTDEHQALQHADL